MIIKIGWCFGIKQPRKSVLELYRISVILGHHEVLVRNHEVGLKKKRMMRLNCVTGEALCMSKVLELFLYRYFDLVQTKFEKSKNDQNLQLGIFEKGA